MKKILLLSLLVLFFFTSAQSQYYYTPDNSGSLLGLAKMGNFKIASTIPLEGQANVQAGFSPLRHLGISGSYFKHDTSNPGIVPGTFGHTYSVAIGTYLQRKKQSDSEESALDNSSKSILFDLYLGYASSEISNTYASAASTQFKYQKTFLQLGVHFQSSFVDLSTALRISNLDYKTAAINGQPDSSEVFLVNSEILVNEPYIIMELDLRLQVGPPPVKAFAGATIINTSLFEKSLLADRKIIFSAGVVLSIDELLKLRKRKE